MKSLMVVLALGIVGGCSSMPPVEVCYTHPKYGNVCVKVGGKLAYAEDLTPAQRAEVEEWMKSQPK